jgi:hypothetical protein
VNVQVNPEHVMQVMDPNGHTTVTWNPDVPDSVASAHREFERLRRLGYQAWKMDVVLENGVVVEEKSDRISAFDPALGKVMMMPHLVGG